MGEGLAESFKHQEPNQSPGNNSKDGIILETTYHSTLFESFTQGKAWRGSSKIIDILCS
jgi:hypothetical protein